MSERINLSTMSFLADPTSAANTYDFIIVGAGIAGTVLASRLRQRNFSLSILLVEAGADSTNHPLVPSPLTVQSLKGTELDWNYATTPQRHLDGQSLYAPAGKALGGGSVINYGKSSFLKWTLRELDRLILVSPQRPMDSWRCYRLRFMGKAGR